MKTSRFLQNLLCCGGFFPGGFALLMASLVSLHLPFLLVGLGSMILGVLGSPPLRKSFHAFAQALRVFPH